MPRIIAAESKPKHTKRTIRKFIKSLKPWAAIIIIAMVLAAGATVCGIFGPMILGQMTNSAVEDFSAVIAANGGENPGVEILAASLNWGKLANLAALLIILYVAAALLNYIQGVLLSIVSAKYAEKMRGELVRKISRLPVAYFDKNQIGDTISRVSNDAGMVSYTLSGVLTEMITSLATLVGVFVLMISINLELAMLTLLVVPASLVAVAFVAKKAQKYFRTQQSTMGVLDSAIEEDFSGQIVIKANSYQEKAAAKFKKTNDKLYEAGWKAQFFSSLAHPLTHFFTHANYVLICVIGGRMVIDGKLLIGNVQAFFQYASQFNRPLTQVSQITANIQQTLAGAERIFEFLDEKEEVETASDVSGVSSISSVKGAVEFHKVNFEYKEGEPLIKNFSVKIKPGMKVAIVGPTGAGKTTLINLLMRFYDPTTGYITIDDTPTTAMTRESVRSLFGMVLQDTWLFSGTIEENLRYGNPEASHKDIVAAAKACSVDHFIESLGKGYKTEISEDSDNISAGEKQLLTIVRAMVANQPMMILDEATSNVDTRTEQLIQDAFTKLTEGRTSFVIAHRLSTIRNSDLILAVREGEIVEKGTHEELLRAGGFYAELYNSQFAEG